MKEDYEAKALAKAEAKGPKEVTGNNILIFIILATIFKEMLEILSWFLSFLSQYLKRPKEVPEIISQFLATIVLLEGSKKSIHRYLCRQTLIHIDCAVCIQDKNIKIWNYWRIWVMKDDTFQVEQYKKKLAKDLKRAKTGKWSTPVVFSHTVKSCYIRPKNREDPKLIRNPKIFWILKKK